MIKHIAFIMDGNRRWAKKRGILKVLGHKEGANTIKTVSDFCLEWKINYLSLYTFSIENFNRSEKEKAYLFNLIIEEANKALEDFIENKIRVRFIGDRSLFPKNVVPALEKIEKETANFSNLNINFLFCYGARQEILNGVKDIAKQVKSGKLQEEDITEEVFGKSLWTGGVPEPEIIVRTGGHQRLSNFLLYQAAYSEFCFLDCMWPELKTEHLNKIMVGYEKKQRNFGV